MDWSVEGTDELESAFSATFAISATNLICAGHQSNAGCTRLFRYGLADGGHRRAYDGQRQQADY